MGVKQIKAVRMLRQEGHPIKEICRKTGISRNTVRKILRGKEAKFTYLREESNQPAQEPIKEVIESWIKHDSLEGKKYRRTAKRMYNELGSGKYGYSGSYSSVLRCFNEVKEKVNKDPAEVFIPLDFGRGAAAQFDWGEVKAVIGGQLICTAVTVTAVHIRARNRNYCLTYTGGRSSILAVYRGV